jgi:uncharacterized protein (TIGR02246 family)
VARADVEAVARAFHDGFARRDAAALAGLYHDDAKFLPPGMPPSEGRAAIQATMQALLDMGVKAVEIEPLDVREAGELTVEYGGYRLGLALEGGGEATDVGKYVVVHETRADAGTKIVLDIFNSNSPPPG